MKVLITEICTGKPDGVHEIVYTDGREYDLPEELAREFIDERKAQLPPPPCIPRGQGGMQGGQEGESKAGALKKLKEVKHVKE